MKNKILGEAAAPANAVQLSSNRAERVSVLHHANRELPTQKVLDFLKSKLPQQFELAEVVGKWVWIQFENKQPVTITSALSELGFHWNTKRQAWQHPCGLFRDQSVRFDPRKKYGSYFAASQKAA